MSDGFKTTLATIGSIIVIFFLAFCIGMCTSGFRNKVYDVLDVVPENGQNQIIDENDALKIQIEEYTTQINALNNNRVELLAKISELDLTNQEQAKLLIEYQNQISNLNEQIVNLTKQLNDLTTTMNNAIIDYKGLQHSIHLAMYDVQGNFMHHIGYGESYGYSYMAGYDFYNMLNNDFINFKDRLEKSIQLNNDTTFLTVYDYYEILIDGYGTRLDVQKESHNFSQDATANVIILFNGIEYDLQDFIGLIDLNKDYEFNQTFAYGFDADDLICSFNYQFSVNER